MTKNKYVDLHLYDKTHFEWWLEIFHFNWSCKIPKLVYIQKLISMTSTIFDLPMILYYSIFVLKVISQE